MTIAQKLQELIEKSRKEGSPPPPIYTVALGEIQLASGRKKDLDNDSQVNIVRKLVKNNEEGIRLSNKQSFKDSLQRENELLRVLLPVELTVDQLKDLLKPEIVEAIKTCPADGAAIGIVMRAIKEFEVKPSSDTVKAFVSSIRTVN